MAISIVKKYKIELIIFAIAVGVRFSYAAVLQWRFGSHMFISFSDAAMYLRIAYNLLQYHTFSEALDSPFLLPDAMRTILYPLFLSIFQIFKAPLLFIIFIQDILAGSMAVIIYRLSIKIFDSKVIGIIASLLFGFEPMSIYWNNLLMSETLAGFFFLVAVYNFVLENYNWSAVTIGLAALVKPIFFYLAPILFFMYIFLYRRNLFKINRSGAIQVVYWKKLIIMCLVFFIVIFPWALRNKIQFNTWELSSNGWLAIHYFISSKFADIKHVPYSWPLVDPNFYHGRERDIFYYYEFSVAPFYKKYLWDLVSKYPLDFLYFHVNSAVRGFNNHDYNYLMQYVLLPKVPHFNKMVAHRLTLIGQGVWFILYSFLVYGFLIRGRRLWQFFLMSFYLANNLLTGYISVGSGAGRYNLPFLPLTLLLATYGFMSFFTYFKTKPAVVSLKNRTKQ